MTLSSSSVSDCSSCALKGSSDFALARPEALQLSSLHFAARFRSMQLQTSGRLVASRGSHLALPAAQACRMDLPGCSLRLWLQQHLLENVDKRTKQPSCPEMPFCLQQTCAQSANRLEPGRGSHRQRALTSVCLASSISREVLSRADRCRPLSSAEQACPQSINDMHLATAGRSLTQAQIMLSMVRAIKMTESRMQIRQRHFLFRLLQAALA